MSTTLKSDAYVHDNPDTMRREAWMDGKLIYSIEATLLCSKGFRGGKWFPFMLNVGPWETGRRYG